MSASEYIVISYCCHSLIFQQSLIMMAQPLTSLAVGHWIWLQDVDKCLEDASSIIIVSVSWRKAGSSTGCVCPPSPPPLQFLLVGAVLPPLFIHVQYFLQYSEGQSAVLIWHHSPQKGANIKSKAWEAI